MKKIYLVYGFLLLMVFTSCKKNENPTPIPSKSPSVIAAVSDSVSYAIDGITYTAGSNSNVSSGAGSEDANRKLYTSANNMPGYTLTGNPDSVMYFQDNIFFFNSAYIRLYFVKKFFRQQTPLYFPGLKSVLTMFGVGKYALAEDFGWQNSQNGVAIDVAANNNTYSSYNAYNGVGTPVLPTGFQKSSTFEITNFTAATDLNGGYNLEAKFTAIVFDANGIQKQLSNGYLRLHFYPAYAINGY